MRTRRLAARPLHGRPTVSVAIPCFNYGHFLPASVRSALDQEGVDVEVVIVDDCSTDNSGEVAAALAERDPRVRLIRHEHNRGHIDTFNDGLFAANGEYVVKLDADDLLAPGGLARATALLEANPDVGFAYGHPIHFEREPLPSARTRVTSWSIWPGPDWLALRCKRGANCISNPEVVMRATTLRHVGGQRAEVPHTSDLELWLRLAVVSDVGRVNGADQAYYRVHAQSMQRTIHAGVLADLEGRRDAFLLALRENHGSVPRAAELEGDARALACAALDEACRAYDRGRVESVPVPELIVFVVDICPSARQLPQWRMLLRRQRVGAKYSRYMPPFFARAVTRRVLEELDKQRWHRSGL